MRHRPSCASWGTRAIGPHPSRKAASTDIDDLRRLSNAKGQSLTDPGHHRYQLTPLGRRVAVLFTKVYGRVLAPGLAELDPKRKILCHSRFADNIVLCQVDLLRFHYPVVPQCISRQSRSPIIIALRTVLSRRRFRVT
jgi:hypothetical protein